MPNKILLIEADAAFAGEIARSLEARGLTVRVTGDGKEGLDLAHDERFDAIVLCVELPKMSGYSICQKLKKDDALRSVPLVITSAEATPETFEQHKKLKARAEDYLLKPYAPEALLEKLGRLVELAPPPGATEEELVSLEEDLSVETLGDEELAPVELEPEPLEAAPVPAAAPRAAPRASPGAGFAGEDEDLRLLEDAFSSIAVGASGNDDGIAAVEERSVAEPAAADAFPGSEATGPASEAQRLSDDADAALAALEIDSEVEEAPRRARPAPAPLPLRAVPQEATARRSAPVRGASVDALRAAGVRLLEEDGPAAGPAPATPPPAAVAKPAAADAALARELEALRQRLVGAEQRARAADEARQELSSKLEQASASAAKLERELQAARGDAAALRARAEEAERTAGAKAAEASRAAGQVQKLEREVDELRTELVVARGEAEGARSEVDKRTAELRKRVGELEASVAKHEERVVKAFQKIKADEKIREKTRKALEIALQLIDERTTMAEAAPKEAPAPRAVAAGGRE